MKHILLLFCTIITLFSKPILLEKEYKISYGILGELGIAKAKIEVYNDQYTITMHAYTTGIAKFLSQNKQETYKSTGTVINNQYIPKYYSKLVTNNKKYRFKEYNFDHIKKQVTEKKTTKKLKNAIWEEENETQTLNFYAQNDILSLFFNLKYFISNLPQKNQKTYYAIGANKENGKVDINILEKQKLKVFINQKIFSSPKGELYISLDKNGLCDEALLKDVLLFGDIKAKSITKDILNEKSK